MRTMTYHSNVLITCGLAACVLAFGACPADDPRPGQLDGGGGDGGAACPTQWAVAAADGGGSPCSRPATDYVPGSASDPWPACISDDGNYHAFDPNISTVARVAAFEEIITLLQPAHAAPSRQAFIAARVAYTQPEGLDSRVSRREDEHFPAPVKKCADMLADELQQHPDRCVGQAQIQPLLNEAFQLGSQGTAPLLQAARIEAALLWFFYVSVYKEAMTCTAKLKDCDSSYAYYTGGESRSGGLGLARYVRAVSEPTHERVWDGVLATRCWRDLDGTEPATDLQRRDQALDQLDRALLHGLAQIVRSRVAVARSASCPAARAALWTSAQILGRVLDREAIARDPARAAELRAELAQDASAADGSKVAGALQALFPCP